MQYEYNDIYQHISDQERAETARMSKPELAAKVKQLDADEKVNLTALTQACDEGKKAGGEGAYHKLAEAAAKTLHSFQLKNYIAETYLGQHPDLNGYIGALSWVAGAMEGIDEDDRPGAFASADYRRLMKREKKYHALEESSLTALILGILLPLLFWIAVHQMFTSDWMAGVLAISWMGDFSYAVLVILALVAIIFLVQCGLGLIWGTVIGVVGVGVLGMLSQYGFGLVIKLIPSIAPTFENAQPGVTMLCFPVYVILVIVTLFLVLGTLAAHLQVIGKKGKLKKLRAQIAASLPALEEEFSAYGMIMDLTDICEAGVRWEGEDKNLTKYTREQVISMTDRIRRSFDKLLAVGESLA